MALTALSSFLPWVVSPGSERLGVALSDGQMSSIVAIGGIGLIFRDVKAAWIAAGFCVAISLRASAQISSVADDTVGVGVWASGAMAAVATGLLIARYLQRIRTEAALSAGDDDQ